MLLVACTTLVGACGDEKKTRPTAEPDETFDVTPPRPKLDAAAMSPEVAAAPSPDARVQTSAMDAGTGSEQEVAAIVDASEMLDAVSMREVYAPLAPVPRDAGTPNSLVIDDFEDCDSTIYGIAGRGGSWYLYKDMVADTVVDPPSWTAVTGGAPGSTACSARAVGEIAAMGFGGMGTATSEDSYDVSMYGGISFYAKGVGTIRFVVQTDATIPKDNGGTCEAMCWDSHGFDVELTDQWKRYEVTWGRLMQAGWGAAVEFDRTKTRNIQWQFNPGAFDLQLDDIRFISAAAPTDARPDAGTADQRPGPRVLHETETRDPGTETRTEGSSRDRDSGPETETRDRGFFCCHPRTARADWPPGATRSRQWRRFVRRGRAASSSANPMTPAL